MNNTIRTELTPTHIFTEEEKEAHSFDQSVIATIRVLYEYSPKRVQNKTKYKHFINECRSQLTEIYDSLSRQEKNAYVKFLNRVEMPQIKDVIRGMRGALNGFSRLMAGEKEVINEDEVTRQYTLKTIAEELEFYVRHGAKNHILSRKKREDITEKEAAKLQRSVQYHENVKPKVAQLIEYINKHIQEAYSL